MVLNEMFTSLSKQFANYNKLLISGTDSNKHC